MKTHYKPIIKLAQPIAPWHVVPVLILMPLAALLARPSILPPSWPADTPRLAFVAMLILMGVFCSAGYLFFGWFFGLRHGRWFRIRCPQLTVKIFRRFGPHVSIAMFFCRCFLLAAGESLASMIILAALLERQLADDSIAIAFVAPCFAAMHLICQFTTNKPSLTAPAIIEER
jgi:hypothetical protein